MLKKWSFCVVPPDGLVEGCFFEFYFRVTGGLLQIQPTSSLTRPLV